MYTKRCVPSYIECGEVYQNELPNSLNKSEPPIVLAQVSIDTKCIQIPFIFIKYSEFINFTLLGINPKINIIYRLVRYDECSSNSQVLQEWEFGFESIEIEEIGNLDTSQPTVLNYCDTIGKDISNKIIYRLEIVQIETNNVISYGLTNQSITATSTQGLYGCRESYLPYTKCGEVFNPVLPLNLTKEDNPIVLTQLTINKEHNQDACLLINFSGFITSVLKDDHFNDLTFRLVKTCSDCSEIILREWPFRRVFVNDTNIKEPVVYDYCECLTSKCDLCCTYTIQLVEAQLSQNSYYEINQKSMTAQVYSKLDYESLCYKNKACCQGCESKPYLNCGQVCDTEYLYNLDKEDNPIDLALVKADTRNIRNPHVLINYSQNLEFEFLDFNPKLSIVYRLIRKSNCSNYTEVLGDWTYSVSEVIPSIVQDLNTIEPLVINYCDDLYGNCDDSFTYILQIVETITENTSFNITNQEISAIVSQ